MNATTLFIDERLYVNAIITERMKKMWFILALLSSIFAALTSILAKMGIENVNSNLATAIRTVVVVGMA